MKNHWCLYAACSVLSMHSLHAFIWDKTEDASQQAEPQKFEHAPINDPLSPGHYQLRKKSTITLTGSALYWKAYEEGLDYAIKSDSGITNVRDGSVKRMEFGWDWGFRAGLGYQFPNEKMDLSAIWTCYESSGTNSTHATFPSTLFSVWTYPGAGLSSEAKAKAKASLKMNMVDLLMGATFTPRRFLDIKPFIGLTSAWIDQTMNIHLSGGSSTQIVNATVLDDHIHLRNNFWGIGPKLGINTTWILGWGFSIVGNADVSVFYGIFDLKQDETVALLGITPDNTYSDIDRNRQHLLRANLDLMIGMRWDILFNRDRCHFGIEAGWENMLLSGQNQLMRFVTPGTGNPGINVSGKGDLCLQGITLKGCLSF